MPHRSHSNTIGQIRCLTRTDMEVEESRSLAPYATKSIQGKGRFYKEKEHPYRTAYQRDRDRVIHSSAFRRLEYKTQVFVNHEGDYYRTRLTHTLEANQIARVIAKVLRLNSDLVEAISLAHDLGHTPFGHAGEDELDQLMKSEGGFNHNLQSLRIVDYLEEQYPNFRGLNLTYETRLGLFKHPEFLRQNQNTGIDIPAAYISPSLESQVADLSDEIAYDNHDLDDGLASGMIAEEELKKIKLWARAEKVGSFPKAMQPRVRVCEIIRRLINMEVTDLIQQSKKNILKAKIKKQEDVHRYNKFLISFSAALSEDREELRLFLKEKLYLHYRVIRMTDKAKRFVRALFEVYLSRPEQLPPGSQKRLKKEGAPRVICDYIAGMTDRYAQDEYRKFFEPFEKV